MDRRKFIVAGVTSAAATAMYANGFSNILSLDGGEYLSGKMMGPDILEIPMLMNMGFHYTRQYSRRTRVNVMGVVDQSSEEWERWYLKMHDLGPLKKMADAGYKIIEIHFMYGFGPKGEKSEYELTKKMVDNAHQAGIKVLGYFQFFSVQKELFFIENPWAADCLQLKADGTPHTYAYDRPALCFTHKQVQDYYLDGVEIGLKYCGLDGIRLDNDYYLGCFCKNCQKEFTGYLKEKFSAKEAIRIFGYEQFDEMELVPDGLFHLGSINDPLYLEMVKFRMLQRQKIMKLISGKVKSVKPGAILGGNPAICRTLGDSSKRNFYIPDFGGTHDLVCSENSLFPARTGNSVRHQIIAYKHGQANNFKVFASHHLCTTEGKTRWPENKEECALSLCEALAFGGHVPCTTWGIRMDGTKEKTLYERPHFIAALTSVKNFLGQYGHIYRNTEPAAEVGVYLNRETHICDSHAYWYSLQGMVQLLVREKIPFRFVDTDEDSKLNGLKLLLVGNVRLVSDNQLERFKNFAKKNKVIATGESFFYDEYFLKREGKVLDNLFENKNIVHLKDCPEKVLPNGVSYHGNNYGSVSLPPEGDKFIKELKAAYDNPIKVSSSPFVAIDIFQNREKEIFIHILNYDNLSPQDVTVEFNMAKDVQAVSPQIFGFDDMDCSEESGNVKIKLKNLHTYAVIKATAK
jgi:hypothetical protein